MFWQDKRAEAKAARKTFLSKALGRVTQLGLKKHWLLATSEVTGHFSL